MGDFYASTPNASHIINFSTTPDWMWNFTAPYIYPHDVNTIDDSYNSGTQLSDPTLKQVGDYYARLVSWYVHGGFTDECGVYHHSGHHYDIEYWEVLNEPNSEHHIMPAYYNKIYDAVVTAIHAVSPNTKFVGIALSTPPIPNTYPFTDYFQGFLDPSNHETGVLLDCFSYHWYAQPAEGTSAAQAASSYQAVDDFLPMVAEVEAIRKQHSPTTRTLLDEVGTISPDSTIPDDYWVWSGGVYAYLFSHITAMGIDCLGESQLVGYPGQFPSVSMVNWTTGLPTARLRVLELLQQSFAPGDSLVQTNSTDEDLVHGQAFMSPTGALKLLLINKQEQPLSVDVSDFKGSTAKSVDISTGGGPWRTETVTGSTFSIAGYATAVLTGSTGDLPLANLTGPVALPGAINAPENTYIRTS